MLFRLFLFVFFFLCKLKSNFIASLLLIPFEDILLMTMLKPTVFACPFDVDRKGQRWSRIEKSLEDSFVLTIMVSNIFVDLDEDLCTCFYCRYSITMKVTYFILFSIRSIFGCHSYDIFFLCSFLLILYTIDQKGRRKQTRIYNLYIRNTNIFTISWTDNIFAG